MTTFTTKTLLPYTEMHPNIRTSDYGIITWPMMCYRCNIVSLCGSIHLYGEVSEFQPIGEADEPDYVATLTDVELDRWSESLQGNEWETYPINIGGDETLWVLDDIRWIDTRVMAVIREMGISWRYRVSSIDDEPPVGRVSIVNACNSCSGDLGMITTLVTSGNVNKAQLINVDDAQINDCEFRANITMIL